MGKAVVLFTIIALLISFAGCGKKSPYGLSASDGRYLYSYYIEGSELIMKDGYDFAELFRGDEYRQLESLVDSLPGYHQPGPLYLPIVQKTVAGDKYVVVFEKVDKEFEGICVTRLAIECDTIRDTLVCPGDFQGYHMVDGWEWPPDICAIDSGKMVIRRYSPVIGSMSGTIEIYASDTTWADEKARVTTRSTAGSFFIRERSSTLFLSLPAREGYEE